MADTPITLLDDWRSGQRCPWSVTGSKRRWLARSVSGVDTVLVHATGTLGGFGLTVEQRRDALVRLRARGLDLPLDAPQVALEARLHRYRKTPYHGLYSPRARVSVAQWAATDFTYHGNAPNRASVGWAYDGKFTPSEADELDAEGGRESLRHLIRAAVEQGCPLRRISPHANHAPPPKHAKPHDPGPRVWLEVVRPVAEEFGLELANEWTTGGAKPWAKRWMEAA